MAGPTRLELATSGVTGRRSNQLNYDPVRLRAGALRRDKHLLCRVPLSRVSPSRACCAVARRRRAKASGRYRIRTCDSRRVKPVLYH